MGIGHFDVDDKRRKPVRRTAKSSRPAVHQSSDQVIYIPGEIIYNSWGYDQTNIDFYKILERKGNYITIVEMNQEEYKNPNPPREPRSPNELWGQGQVVPTTVKSGDKPFRRMVRIDRDGKELGVQIASYGWAKLWDGKPAHYTSYA